ncbi:hemin uptake protein HemP [Pandoraea fibrosis]|jgi:hemin uptake protein HemP|uniref:Hemin uptake protein HemP n=2 Tax=Pandoraea fibrosis TaxID=1891094 RepID=A0ABX6HNZ3_9BURK|nr:hemin uptake protein HemP [Pandoraea fibrosis]QHE91154.1 hemin uptake protein HemP [Pandoraea fibrosis]QHF11985.1 hemin uptake protein HemP [Pandoraea fibrosis]
MSEMTASHTTARQTQPATAPRRTLSVSRTQVASPAADKPASHATGRVLTSDHLLQGTQCVNILHNGQTYQLRATRYGKLILTK